MLYLRTEFGDSRFSRSGDMIAGIDIEIMSQHDQYTSLNYPLLTLFVCSQKSIATYCDK